MDDQQLLREFRETRSESAFQILAQRHVDLVYAAALRRLGNPDQAQETTQNVFIALARRAPSLPRDVNLAGWLYKATVLEAIRRYRDEQRHKRREATAVEMGTTMKDDDRSTESLASELDDALMELRETDRRVVLLRFFEHKSLREVGEELGIAEDAAQKRVAKSVEQLTRWFRRHGYGVGTTALTVAALKASAKAAPHGLAALAARVALQEAAVTSLSGVGLLLSKLMILTKTQATVAALIVAAVPVAYHWHALRGAQSESRSLDATLTALREGINSQERSAAALERKLAYTQAVSRQAADSLISVAGRPAPDMARLYLWDEQSPYVRLPKGLASHLAFAPFQLQPRGKAKPERVQLPPVGPDGTPSPPLLDALGLTTDEAQVVSDTVRKTFAEFAASVAQSSYLTNLDFSMIGNSEHQTWFTPALPSEGEQYRQSLSNALTQVMGQERTQAFWEQSANVFRDVLNEFGQAPKAVTVAHRPGGGVAVGEMYFRPDGSHRLNSGSFDTSLGIPAALQPYVDAWKQADLTQTGANQP
jgi:RNA polymerase sigma factor (sigma-70 family)